MLLERDDLFRESSSPFRLHLVKRMFLSRPAGGESDKESRLAAQTGSTEGSSTTPKLADNPTDSIAREEVRPVRKQAVWRLR